MDCCAQVRVVFGPDIAIDWRDASTVRLSSSNPPTFQEIIAAMPDSGWQFRLLPRLSCHEILQIMLKDEDLADSIYNAITKGATNHDAKLRRSFTVRPVSLPVNFLLNWRFRIMIDWDLSRKAMRSIIAVNAAVGQN